MAATDGKSGVTMTGRVAGAWRDDRSDIAESSRVGCVNFRLQRYSL